MNGANYPCGCASHGQWPVWGTGKFLCGCPAPAVQVHLAPPTLTDREACSRMAELIADELDEALA